MYSFPIWSCSDKTEENRILSQKKECNRWKILCSPRKNFEKREYILDSKTLGRERLTFGIGPFIIKMDVSRRDE